MIDTERMIRLAGRRELDAVAALVADAFAHYRGVLPAHIFDPYLKDSCDFASRWGQADIAVLEMQGCLVGTVTYYADASHEGMGWPSGVAGLRTLAVAPSAQGHGYGRALCLWCIGRARQDRAHALTLHTAEFMTAACKLYEGLGFCRQPSHDLAASSVLGFGPGQADQKIIAYALPLADAGHAPDH